MRRAAAVLAAVLAAAGTACAGGDDARESAEAGAGSTAAATEPAVTTTTEAADTRPEPPPDQDRWARQADEACAPWQERLDALAAPTDSASLQAWVADAVPLVKGQAAAVAAVKPPPKAEDARRARLFVEALRKIERGLTRYGAALRAQDAAGVEAALADANAAGAEARGYAASLDVTRCGGYSGG